MRRLFIAGNWKMNLTRQEAVELAQGIVAKLSSKSVDVAVCPTFVHLESVDAVLQGSSAKLGAQNMSDQDNGAFTGEISSAMLLDMGCEYVILGHSERRQMGETDAQVNSKLKQALKAGLKPIVCLGELLEEREAGNTNSVIETQFDGSLAGLTNEQMATVTIAYEPVWAIGTGKVATTEQAEAVHLHLRKLLESRYNSEVAEQVRIQYGGSVKPENAKELLAQPNIDGALVGGASLKPDSFIGIINASN